MQRMSPRPRLVPSPEAPVTPLRRGRPPERIRVIVQRRIRGEEPVTHDVLWPKGWPLPEVGTIVHAGPLAGWVEHLEFDLDGERILLVLRG